MLRIPPSVASTTLTCFEGFQRKGPLSSRLGTVVLHHSEAQKTHVFEVHRELEDVAPHGVEGVAVDRFGAKVAAIHRQTQNIHLNTGAAGAVTRTDILTRDHLNEG